MEWLDFFFPHVRLLDEMNDEVSVQSHEARHRTAWCPAGLHGTKFPTILLTSAKLRKSNTASVLVFLIPSEIGLSAHKDWMWRVQ
jgi:hypothetical protein